MTQNYDELLELADDIEATWHDEDYKGSTLGKLAAAVRELQAENATIYNQAIEDAVNWHVKEIDEISRLLETGIANSDGEIQMVMERQFHKNSAPQIRQLKRPTPEMISASQEQD